MDSVWTTLPGAAAAGTGAVLAGLGYRLLKFYTLGIGVGVFAAAGCALGAALGSPTLAATLTIGGAFLGYFLGPVLFYVYVGLSAAASAVLALLDARGSTIAWTSTSGAAVATLGILLANLDPQTVVGWAQGGTGLAVHAARAGIFFVTFTIAGALFQVVTTREAPKSAPQKRPAAA